MNKSKALELWSNYVNGNLSDFKADVKKLNKLGLIDFIYFVLDEYQDIKFTAQEVLSIVYKALGG
ncbi:MAG: hypothetical protein WC307_06830 [Candidatus Nanoarchaeia archaeon]